MYGEVVVVSTFEHLGVEGVSGLVIQHGTRPPSEAMAIVHSITIIIGIYITSMTITRLWRCIMIGV